MWKIEQREILVYSSVFLFFTWMKEKEKSEDNLV